MSSPELLDQSSGRDRHIATRRQWMGLVAASPILASISPNLESATAADSNHEETFDVRYCLNTSTIQGEKIDITEQIQIAAEAGYEGIEIWLRDVDRYLQSGGKAAELRKRIADGGLKLESAIAFAPWIVDDVATRTKGLEQAAREMDLVQQLGGTRIAAPPAGATQGGKLNLDAAAERYAALLDLGREQHCLPMLEVWGFSENLSRLCEVLYICAASGHPDACILPDVYHLYKGGSNFAELGLLSGSRVHVFHMNDYPSSPARPQIQDADRVYPTDGVAPLREILGTMRSNGFGGALSLELFNRSYWAQDPRLVAKTGIEKMKQAVALLD